VASNSGLNKERWRASGAQKNEHFQIILCLATLGRMHSVMHDIREQFCLLFNFIHPVLYTPFLFLVLPAEITAGVCHGG
jgi:hypothetical protein